MNARCRLQAFLPFCVAATTTWAATVSTPYGISRQVNVDSSGQNIPGDAANEPSLCIDPTDSSRMAVGWRQFDTITSSFRQSGWAFTTNGGLDWSFPGMIDPGIFRSDPVLASDANGTFYYIGITNVDHFYCDLWRSTDGGASWQFAGQALGGDKEWMAVDTTSGPGRGNIYQVWSPFYTYAGNNRPQIFTRSTDGGQTWINPIAPPHSPYWGTMDVGPDGELYLFGRAYDLANTLVVDRSTNAQDPLATPSFDLSVIVNLGGPPIIGLPGINPVGLLGQAWIAVDRSAGPFRGNVYVLCSVTNDPGNLANVMFARSTDAGATWSAALRINDDSPDQHACHWFGTLAVAPNGRLDACWYDTRNSPNNSESELYYSWSDDAGLSWAPNRPISPPFNQSLGYPQQSKIGDYIQIVSLEEGACIAYSATFNGEQDIYFVRAELPVTAVAFALDNAVRISWNSVPGVSYCVESIADLSTSWSTATNVACLTASSAITTVEDPIASPGTQRFYRVLRQP